MQQNTVSYLRPVKLDGKDGVPIQVQNWTLADSAREDLEDAQDMAANQSKNVMERRAK